MLYVQTTAEAPDKIALDRQRHLINNFMLATELGAEIVIVDPSMAVIRPATPFGCLAAGRSAVVLVLLVLVVVTGSVAWLADVPARRFTPAMAATINAIASTPVTIQFRNAGRDPDGRGGGGPAASMGWGSGWFMAELLGDLSGSDPHSIRSIPQNPLGAGW